MKDQLVGQLWKQWFMPVPLEELTAERATIIVLIRKLVDERAKGGIGEAIALREFGIDPETWK